jgi:hypothetical protein
VQDLRYDHRFDAVKDELTNFEDLTERKTVRQALLEDKRNLRGDFKRVAGDMWKAFDAAKLKLKVE